ncbi:MAG: hypothetical protein ABI472_02520 [Ginsengibacter sp.]
MSRRILLAVCVFCMHAATAQKEYPVKAGEIPNEVLPNEAMYVFPAFTEGVAWFKNGTSSTQRFNYNFLLDEMHFINEGGDTLAIADPLLISYLVIDSLRFYFDNGYVREIFKKGDYKLALKQQMVQIPYKKRGGYDMPTETGSIETYGSISNSNGKIAHLQVKKDILFRQVNSFYIADSFNHFLRADKKNFYALFASEKISNYLEEHKVNFNKKEDLEAMLQFCQE